MISVQSKEIDRQSDFQSNVEAFGSQCFVDIDLHPRIGRGET